MASRMYAAVLMTAAPGLMETVLSVNCVKGQEMTTLLPPKHIRLGLAAVVVINPKTGVATQVYAFHDSGSTMRVLRRSVADQLGLTGIKYIQKCKDILSSKDLQMESASIQVV